MKLKVTVADVYYTCEAEIKQVQKFIEEEQDQVMKNELRLLKDNLTQAMLKARQIADIKLEQARLKAINITGKRI
jgi:hypothetical protein